MTALPGLDVEQRAAVHRWFPGATLVADHSWGQVGRAVLQLHHDGRDVLVKAGPQHDHHMAREITAHEDVVRPLAALLAAPRPLRADRGLRLLATTYLPGDLVEGRPEEWEPETYRQAGRLLAVLHAQGARPDDRYEAAEDARALALLDGVHRVDRGALARIRDELRTPAAGPRTLVPTHGDWQPRNWVVDGGRVAVIDFGRAGWRPAESDLARLAAQQFRERPHLEAAFLEGYGGDPRTPSTWRRVRLREAVATAVWAHRVGDEAFEQQGHRMIEDVLGDRP